MGIKTMVRGSKFDFNIKFKLEKMPLMRCKTISLTKMLKSSETMNSGNDDRGVIFISKNRFILQETLSTRNFLFRLQTKIMKVCICSDLSTEAGIINVLLKKIVAQTNYGVSFMTWK